LRGGAAVIDIEPPPVVPNTPPLVRVMAMPADANPNGDIFGGWLLA
jgi:acyl-CoA thioesterase YciA